MAVTSMVAASISSGAWIPANPSMISWMLMLSLSFCLCTLLSLLAFGIFRNAATGMLIVGNLVCWGLSCSGLVNWLFQIGV